MFGWGKRKEDVENVILNDAYGYGELGADINDGERTDDMLSRGIRVAQEVHGITDPDQISDFAIAYANGYKHKVYSLELEDDFSINPYTKPKD